MAVIYLILGSLIPIVGFLFYKYFQLKKFNHQNYNTINGLIEKYTEIIKSLSKNKRFIKRIR